MRRGGRRGSPRRAARDRHAVHSERPPAARLVQVPLGRPPVQVAEHPTLGDPGAEHVGDQPVQSVPPATGPTACTKRFAAASSASVAAPLRPPVRASASSADTTSSDADPHEELEQFRGQPVDHFVQQVRGHRVVVARERIDEVGGVGHALQLEGGQPQPGGPALGPLDEPIDVLGVQVDLEPVEQGAGLVRPEGEVGGPDLAEHPGQAQPVQRPRRVPAGCDHEPEIPRRALNQSQQTLVHDEPVTSCRLSSTRTTGVPSAASAAANCPGACSRSSSNGLAQCAQQRGPRPAGRAHPRRTSRKPADRRRPRGARSMPPRLGPPAARNWRATSCPSRRGRRQDAGALETPGHPAEQPGTRHHVRDDRNRELGVHEYGSARGQPGTVADSHAGRRIIRFLSSCDRHHGTPPPPVPVGDE